MELYIGGYGQGKLKIVKQKYPDAPVFDESTFQALEGRASAAPVIWNHMHLSVKKMLEEGMTSGEIKAKLLLTCANYPALVVIGDEIGCGIVPLDESERIYREEAGRMMTMLATKADRVERIVCGMEQILK